MLVNSASVSGWREVLGACGKVVEGSESVRREWRPGIDWMVDIEKEVQGRICRMSHQKCLVLASRMWMLSWRTRAGAGLGAVR